MSSVNGRNVLAGLTTGTGGLLAYVAMSAEPSRMAGIGGTDQGPRDPVRDQQNPGLINPPSADQATLLNLRFSFAGFHVRQESRDWTSQITERELGVSKGIAAVDMRLNVGGIREMHWHKDSEWAYMPHGIARITAIDGQGRDLVEDVGVGDLWYSSGIPHSIRGLSPGGCESLLVFDGGGFGEESTFLLSDWFKHVPGPALALARALPERLTRFLIHARPTGEYR